MVREVVSASPDVIITSNNSLVLRFKALVHSILVVAIMDDPLAHGIVTSLARPDGNITGTSTNAGEEIWGKRLATLLEAESRHLSKEYTKSQSIDVLFEVLEREQAEVLLVSDSMENLVRRYLVVALAERFRLPALYSWVHFVVLFRSGLRLI